MTAPPPTTAAELSRGPAKRTRETAVYVDMFDHEGQRRGLAVCLQTHYERNG